MSAGAVAALRAFTRPRPAVAGDACDLCGAGMAEPHAHLVDPPARALRCVCPLCAAAAPRGAKAIEPKVERLAGEVDELAWAALGIPVGLAFIVHWSAGDEVVAFFPGAGGVATSTLDRVAWSQWSAVARLRPDVEALLVHRLGGQRQQFLVSLDRAFELLGHLRARGARPAEAQTEVIDAFFAELGREAHD